MVCLHWYLSILLYVKLFQCSGDLWSIGGGMGSVCTGVVVFHTSMVNWRRRWILSTLVSVHSSICEC